MSDLDVGGPSYIPNWEDSSPQSVKNRMEYTERALHRLGVTLGEKAVALEIGSGKGLFLKLLEEKGVQVVGVDAHPRGPREPTQMKGRVEDLRFADNTFDIVFSAGVFDADVYEQQDQQKMLQEIARVLRPGGLYAAYVEVFGVPIPENLKLMPGTTRRSLSPIYQKVA